MYKRNEMTGFVGAGNMATALIKGLMESGTYRKEQLRAFDKDQGACERLARGFGVACTSSNGELVRACATVVLAVKPQNMRDALSQGADIIVVGRYITQSKDIERATREFLTQLGGDIDLKRVHVE